MLSYNLLSILENHQVSTVKIEVFDPTKIYDTPDFDDWLPEEDIQNSRQHENNGDNTIRKGQRNDTLFRKACRLQAQGASDEAILKEIRKTKCTATLPDDEIQSLVHSATTRYPKGSPEDNDKGLIKEMVDRLLANHFFAKDPGNLLYHFEAGCYWPKGEEFVSAQFQKILEQDKRTKQWSTHRGRELTAYLTVQAPTLWETPPSEIINLRNGLHRVHDVGVD